MVATELPKLKPFQGPNPEEPEANWHGYLTAENVHQVAATLTALLKDRRFTTTTVHEYRGWEPEVRTGCRLHPEHLTSREHVDSEVREDQLSDGTPYVWSHLGFSAGGYSWGLHSRLRVQPPWFWLYQPDAEMARKLHVRGEGAYLDERGYQHGRPGDVLAYIDAANDAHWSAAIVIEHGRTVRWSQRTPEGKGMQAVLTIERDLKHTRAALDRLEMHAESSKSAAALLENARWELDLDG